MASLSFNQVKINMATHHFISGLPRSGSTLLSALLKQNPRFYANMSGPLAGLVGSLLERMSGQNEFSVFIDDQQRETIIRSLMQGYYQGNTEEVIFDTSRGWCKHSTLLKTLHPESKIIACVRDMPWIIDSIERLVDKNVFQPSSIFNYLSGGTVYSRVDGVAGGNGMVGYAFNALKQAYFGEHAPTQLMLLQYETLVSDPERALNELYQFIGEPFFKHDFNNINFDVAEFDKRAGTPGLHTVGTTLKDTKRNTILPPDIFGRFAKDAFWRNPEVVQKYKVKVV
jgi:sulfotransferase